ncbi:MAG: CDP-glycerol glycerophosphotransferase family protein, partial [Oscillospiraceae bacterium]
AIPDVYWDFARDVSGSMRIDHLLSVSDICISDYSSLIFEYSLYERPMLFLAPDIDNYNDWRGFYYDYNNLTPGPVVTTTGEVADYVKQLESGFDKSRVTAFKHKFMASCDGKATEKIFALMTKNSGE